MKRVLVEVLHLDTFICFDQEIRLAVGELTIMNSDSDELVRGPWIFHQVESVDGQPQPSPWITPYKPWPRIDLLSLPRADGITQGLRCPQCHRLTPHLHRLPGGHDRCSTCLTTTGTPKEIPGSAGPIVIEDNDRLLLLASAPTVDFPDAIPLTELLAHPMLARDPDDLEHPRWILAVHDFIAFVWAVAGLNQQDPGWAAVLPAYQPIHEAWQRGDWDALQTAIARGKEYVRQLPNEWLKQPQSGAC